MPMAARLARKYRNRGESQDDLEQAAYLALVKSVDRYSADAGPFERYAVPCILGELKRYFRDHSWAMRVPRSAKENHLKLREYTDAFEAEHGRTPTVAELVELSGLELDQVVEALEADEAFSPRPLDAPLSGEDPQTLGETVGGSDPGFEIVELAASVAPAFNALPLRERQMLKLRFSDDLTQRQIAARMGCSQMQVSRVLRASLERLRERVEDGASQAEPSAATKREVA
jgi:RNA polymerase sigma-B factor